jgi:hypothetical protein
LSRDKSPHNQGDTFAAHTAFVELSGQASLSLETVAIEAMVLTLKIFATTVDGYLFSVLAAMRATR